MLPVDSSWRWVAHRGDSARCPENTLESFEAAIALGAKWIEFDVHLSKDKVPMVFHDDTLKRMCQCSGKLAQFTAKELERFKVRGQAAIPRLDRVLKLAEAHRVGVYIELKDRGSAIVEAVAPLVLGLTVPLRVSSFHTPTLVEAERHLPRIPLMALTQSRWSRPWKFLPKHRVKEIGLSLELSRTGMLDRLIAKGWNVLVFTVNDPQEAQRLRSKGVTGVFCDYAGGLDCF